MWREHFHWLIGCSAALIFVAGCETAEIAGSTDRYVVSAPQSQFYRYGPAQAFGADSVLQQGQPITMVKREFGFSRVMLANGQSGYVATDDMKPAPPATPPPKATPPKQQRMSGGGRKRSEVQPGSVSAPLFDLSDVPAPALPKEPENPPLEPKFRY